MKKILIFSVLFLIPGWSLGQSLPLSSLEASGFDPDRFARVDSIIRSSIEEGDTPGAVLMVVRNGSIVYRRAYGNKETTPEVRPMDVNTIFDLASLTKPVATATSIMLLVERGVIRLLDPVSHYIPDFEQWVDPESGRNVDIRIIHLLTHTSGLPSYAPVESLAERYGSPAPDAVIEYLKSVPRASVPGTFFRYSCPNYITLQRIVETVSGKSLHEYTRENIFEPLEMLNTGYRPAAVLRHAIAPTELLDGEGLLFGTVHDPLARVMMGGISGNAGLFSTADDLARYAAMLLNEGELDGVRILGPLTVRAFTSVPSGYEAFGRSLGWDLSSSYASNQGDLFGVRTYGHTGYTGTSLIIDPETRIAVILLTNRVHPDDAGSVVRLRSQVANSIAGAVIE
jgi:serine-type D-Ala-D-Ala carboxypeptidase